MEEQGITLKQAAERLGVSYGTIFQYRDRIGFQLPDGRKWVVLPSLLANLFGKRSNVTRLSLRVDGVKECQSAKMKKPASGISTSVRQAEKELDALLAQRTKSRPRNITTA